MQNEKTSQMVVDDVNAATKNPEIPNFYANGFMCALGTSDIAILLKLSENPIAVINLSYTAAKSLSNHLQKLVSHLENKTDHTIMTIEETKELLTQNKNTTTEKKK